MQLLKITLSKQPSPDDANAIEGSSSSESTSMPLKFVYPMRNHTALRAGDHAKIRCEVRGEPPADEFR